MRCCSSLVLMVLLLSSLGYSANLSAFPSLKPSSIDNRHDIPIGIPIETSSNNTSAIKETNPLIQTRALDGTTKNPQILKDPVSILAVCEKLPVVAVTAIGNDGNVPSNVLDNNLNTRWSNLGTGSWIQLDLRIKEEHMQRGYCMARRKYTAE